MKPTFVHSFLYLAAAGIKFADAYLYAAGCNADNCARGVTGTAVKVPMSDRIADCSKFMGAMGPAPVTITNTVVKTITASSTVGTKTETVTASAEEPEETPAAKDDAKDSKDDAKDDDDVDEKKNKLRRRYGDYGAEKEEKPAPTTTPAPKPAATTSAAAIPGYASYCSGAVRYSSACSCWGIKSGSAAPTTETVVVTQTTTSIVKFTAVVQKAAVVCSKTQEKCGGTCKNVFTDVKNCGACDAKCKDGATCVNGVCSDPSCDDVKEWQCDNESKKGCNGAGNDETFCMKGIKASFCTSFANLPLCPKKEEDGCKTDADCTKGEVCGHIACCGWNICIKPHYPDASGSSNKASASRLFKRENKLKLRKLAQAN
ncbi:uncharacterized protein DFL_004013 [Arthrobotrys flagrans]|uniref:Uncharacterized protein n=1 Tax=Arthrobotrys flagrans TaxID=97331 RepID=A0A437A3H0_ARTFL|nr:hypothetical protein DFL_004013 [Arthrobotrys flagrans]